MTLEVPALFLIGVVEYALAAAWTRSVADKKPVWCATITFVNVMMWGVVVTRVADAGLWLLVVHGAGCALGAALTVKYGGE